MPKFEKYSKKLEYSYALGAFPTIEALRFRIEDCIKVVVSENINQDLLNKIQQYAQNKVRIEVAPTFLSKISSKDNIHVACVFKKSQHRLDLTQNHIVLHNIMDAGNLGTILRTTLGFGFNNIAIIKPATDVFDPHTVRSSMGAVFQHNIKLYDDFEDYIKEFNHHNIYPFMLKASISLSESVQKQVLSSIPYALVFGNEGKGLPEKFAEIGQPTKIVHTQSIDSLNLGNAVSIACYAFTEHLFRS